MNPKDLQQWVCWRSEIRDGKPTKIPYSPMAGARARSDDPRIWGTYPQAREAAEKEGHDGIDFVFTASDPFCGVDLDGCVDPETGEVQPWAAEIVDELDSYAELSPSGTGLHILVRAELPPGGRRKGRVEMYDRGRFFTVTGHHLPGSPTRIEDRQPEIEALHARLFPCSPPEGDAPCAKGAAVATSGLTDAEILRRAMSASNGARFAVLWSGPLRLRLRLRSRPRPLLHARLLDRPRRGPNRLLVLPLRPRAREVEPGGLPPAHHRPRPRGEAGERVLLARHERLGTDSRRTRRGGRVDRSASSSAARGALVPGRGHAHLVPPAHRGNRRRFRLRPELVALPMLAVLSSAIGTSRIVEVKGGWREWAALFVAVVASPGAMKTPAAKVAKKPAFERQRKLGRAYTEEKEDWKREVRQWEVDKRNTQKNGEPAPEEPKAPTMSRCVASDTTVEALVAILEDNPRGLLVHRDELAGWVRSMDQYKGGKGSDRQRWLSFWSGDEVVMDRKSRMGEPIIVGKPFVSLFGGIQPAMLGELGGSVEDGLMDRFLFAYPRPRHARFTEREVSPESEQRYADLYRKLSSLRLATDEHEDPNPRPLHLSPEARKLFAGTSDALGAEMLQPGFPARLEGVWSKLRGYLAHLSLVLAVCRCAEGGAQEERVEREDVEAAALLLAYFKDHTRHVHAELSAPDPLDLLAAELSSLLETAGGSWEGSATDLHRILEAREAEGLPDRPEALSKLALRIGERSPALRVAQGWRKSGGREGKSRRVLKLALAETTLENAVVTVDPEAGRDNGDYGNNGNPAPDREKDEPLANVTNARNRDRVGEGARVREQGVGRAATEEERVGAVLRDPPGWMRDTYLKGYREGRWDAGLVANAVATALGLPPHEDGPRLRPLVERVLEDLGIGQG